MISVKVFGSGSCGNGYLLDDGHSQLIIECGVQFSKVQHQMGHDFSKVVGALITHEHRDHCKYISSLIDKTAVNVYATDGTIAGMFDDQVLKLKRHHAYRFDKMQYKQTKKIGTWYVTPFEIQHDVREPAGFLIDNTAGDRLVFITDSYYVKYKFPNITHMMVEANYSKDIVDQKMNRGFDIKRKERLLESHFDFDRTLDFIKSNKSDRLQEVWLLHLSDANSHEQKFKEETQKLVGVPVYIA
ncbi:Phosphoribosyl 1,2-cyclic phosphodiesterase [Enterococcus casseliflavus]|uniref:MBL fold metallo-hydrolase n=1 Tax=Enterococcus casseliflavus TaxID=37734 RepID=UPI0008EBE7FC|nr:MBL fold metallo-hydrolase [Enterococcus casseliflavus]SFD57337.1 Phosphoribosyl 1,2-cyclic phosphodiesterase [Enterococcus casseliflavus]